MLLGDRSRRVINEELKWEHKALVKPADLIRVSSFPFVGILVEFSPRHRCERVLNRCGREESVDCETRIFSKEKRVMISSRIPYFKTNEQYAGYQRHVYIKSIIL